MLAPKGRSTGQKPIGKRTISAYGAGLTCIKNMCFDDAKGNIFTNAIPPWLCVDEEDVEKETEIGPTMKDYKKHLEREKKKRLPSTRVGAKFDHNAETSAQWLPSFGAVWNKGRRQQTEQYFRRQIKKSRQMWFAYAGHEVDTNSQSCQTWTEQSITGNCWTGQSDAPVTGSLLCQASSGGENQIFKTRPEVKPYRRKRTWTESEETQSSWLTNNFVSEMSTVVNLNSVESTTQNSDFSLYHSERSVYDPSRALQEGAFNKNGTSCSLEKWNFSVPTSFRSDDGNGIYSKNSIEGHRQDSNCKPVSYIRSYESKRKKHLGTDPGCNLIGLNTVADGSLFGRMHSVSLIDTPVLKI